MRIVLDTNLFISILLGSRICRSALNACGHPNITLVISKILIDELTYVLNKPKFSKRISAKNKTNLITFLKTNSELAKPISDINICRDPKDNFILATALAGKAQIIVTGDKDLLALNPFKKILILSPKEFINKLK